MSDGPAEFVDDGLNPYAAPQADFGRPELEKLTPEAIPFAVDAIFARSYEIFKKRMPFCIGLVFGCTALLMAYQLLTDPVVKILARSRLQVPVPVLTLVFTLAGMVLRLWISGGQALVMIKIIRRQPARFEEVFIDVSYLLRIVGATLLMGLAILGVLLVFLIPGGLVMLVQKEASAVALAILGIGGLLGVLVTVRVAVRLSQFVYLIVDRDLGVFSSLRTSNKIAAGSGGPILMIWTLASLINLAGCLACLLGLVFTLPLTELAMAATYVALIGQAEAEARPSAELDFGVSHG